MQTLFGHVLPPRQAKLAVQFVQFGLVGSIGMAWDTATVYALRLFMPLWVAGLGGYLVAATMNWALNRVWTFRREAAAHGHPPSPGRQWALFLAANLPGFVLNRGTFLLLTSLVPLCRDEPVLAIAAGSLAGMAANFTLSRRLVFR